MTNLLVIICCALTVAVNLWTLVVCVAGRMRNERRLIAGQILAMIVVAERMPSDRWSDERAEFLTNEALRLTEMILQKTEGVYATAKKDKP